MAHRASTGASRSAGSPLSSGCGSLVEDIADSCPSDPAASADATWVPDVAHPVFWGVHEITTADGAPRSMSIYYPASPVPG